MISVNDQHPFDVAPDDDRRPAADSAPQSPEQHTAFERTAEDETPTTAIPADAEAQPSIDPAIAADEADRSRRKHRRIAALSVAAAVIFTAGAGGGAVASLALARSTTTASADG